MNKIRIGIIGTGYIGNVHGAFPAAYTNLNGSWNSLLPPKDYSWSATGTASLGVKP